MALALSFAAVAAFVCTSLLALVSALWRVAAIRKMLRAPSAVAVAALLPAGAALLAVLALAVPNLSGACHCLTHASHHPHLCLFHPALAESLEAPAALLLAAHLLLTFPRLLRLGAATWKTTRIARAARHLCDEVHEGVGLKLVDLGHPHAFSVGLLSPVIVVDRTLWADLCAEERSAIVHHEHGHVLRRDALTFFVLRALSSFSPFAVGARLVDGWRRAAERACDRHAASVLGDPTVVAQALVSAERAQLRSAAPPSLPPLALAAVSCCSLEERVMALLEEPTEPAPLVSDLLPLFILGAGATLLVLAWPGSAFHHAVETLIGLTLH